MDADSFHRLAKVLADSGEAKTIEGAQAAFEAYGVRVVLEQGVASDIASQVIALTVINAASRSFMGNVLVEAADDFLLQAPGFAGQRLSEFKAWASVSSSHSLKAMDWPTIQIGSVDAAPAAGVLCPWADGWSCGVGPRGDTGGEFFAPACVAAAGLAVSEAFSMLRGDNPYAGRRALSLSLWQPELGTIAPHEQGPHGLEVPGAWLVGLGHLGQAYAWTVGFMKQSAGSVLALQDVDATTRSTISTSLLSTVSEIGRMKTAVVDSWLSERGFKTSVVERRFDQHQRVGPGEPRLALFGVDNAAARRAIESAGFDFVVDAGLGSGFKDFRALRVRTFPGPSSAAELWGVAQADIGSPQAPAYQALLAAGADPCGVTTLATRAVGAPFVGCVAAAYVIAELLRRHADQVPHSVIDMNLRDPARLQAL